MNQESRIKSKIIIFVTIFSSLFAIRSSLFTREALAHCPLCVAGAGAGLSLSRVLGIDDSITGVWLGALLGAMSFWVNNVIVRKRDLKKMSLPFQKVVIYLLIFVTTTVSFYRFGLINEHNGLILNLPKLTFGMIVGGGLFYGVDLLNEYLKKRNGRVLFPYQSITLSLGSMLITSLVLFVLLNYYI